METLSINEKINVRSNAKSTTRSFEPRFWEINNISRSYDKALQNIKISKSNQLFLHYASMPCNTMNQLLTNVNFQRSYK